MKRTIMKNSRLLSTLMVTALLFNASPVLVSAAQSDKTDKESAPKHVKYVNTSQAAKSNVKSDPAPTQEQTAKAISTYQAAYQQITAADAPVDPSPIDLNKTFDQSPFTIPAAQDSFSTLTGSVLIKDSDMTLIGRNGLDFELKRSYDSQAAQLYDITDYTKNPMSTRIKYDISRSFMGPGWHWNIPTVEYNSTSGQTVVHLAAGGSYVADFNYNKLTGYAYSDLTFRRDTTVDSNYNGYYMSSTKDNLKYYFDSAGKLLLMKDLYNNFVRFNYSATPINYLDFTTSSTSGGNTGYPLTSITNSIGNTINVKYLPATNTASQQMTVSNGQKTITYRYDKAIFNVSATPFTLQVPTLAEVEDMPNHKTTYSYEVRNAWSFGSTATANNSALNPYALLMKITYPTGVKSNYQYNNAVTFMSGTTANDTYRLTDIADHVTREDGGTDIYNHLTVQYNGDICRPLSDGSFNTQVTDDLARVTTYQYKKSSLTNVPFYKLLSKKDVRGDEVNTQSYTYADPATSDPTTIQKDTTSLSQTGVIQSRTINRQYDGWGNLTSEQDPLGGVKQYTFDPTYHWLNQVTEYLQGGPGKTGSQYKQTTYTHNLVTGAVTKMLIKDQAGTTLGNESYVYDTYGSMKSKTIVDGTKSIVTNITLDTDSNFPINVATEVTAVDSTKQTVNRQMLFDKVTGQLKQITDGKKNSTTYQYDSLNRVQKAMLPDKTSVTFLYDDLNNSVEMKTADESGASTLTKRVVSKWNPLGWKMESGMYTNGQYVQNVLQDYDQYGRVKYVTDVQGHLQTNTYDLFDRLVGVTNPDNSQIIYAYDDLNLTKTTTDGSGNVIRELYDLLGNILKQEVVTSNGSNAINKTFDLVGNVLTVKDPKDIKTEYAYDALSEIISVKTADPNTVSSTTYKYDMRGNQTQTTYPDGRTLIKTYDELGGVTQSTDENGLVSKFYYDANHNLLSQLSPNQTKVTLEYDALNQVTKKTATPQIGQADSISYEYDALGNRSKMMDSTGTTQYSFTEIGDVASVTMPDGKKVSYGYDNLGQRTSMTDPFNRVINYVNDGRKRIQSVSLDSGTVASYAYTQNGRVQSLSYANNTSTNYTYNSNNQITDVQQKNTAGQSLNRFKYNYDKNGNITSKQANSDAYTFYGYDVLNRISSSSQNNETYDYDSRGNRKNYNTESPVAEGNNSYEYDVWNRLVKVTTADNKIVSYRYNGEGELYERTEGGKTTRYYVDGSNIIAEADVTSGTPQLIARYIRGAGGEILMREDSQGKRSYYMANSHDDVVDIRDQNGILENSYSYDIWGNLTTTLEKTPNSFLHSGEFYDKTTKLEFLHARWYDPSTGRFLNKDTVPGDLLSPQSQNLYSYVVNNPLRYSDPTGHWCTSADGVYSHEGDCHDSSSTYVPNWYHYMVTAPTRATLINVGIPAAKGIFGPFTAELMARGLSDAGNVTYSDPSSTAVKSIKSTKEYQGLFSNSLNNAKKSGSASFDISTSLAFESNKDVYNALHNVNVQMNGYLDGDGSWTINTTITDLYNFELNIDAMLKSNNKLGWAGANAMYGYQQLGIFRAYNVTVQITEQAW